MPEIILRQIDDVDNKRFVDKIYSLDEIPLLEADLRGQFNFDEIHFLTGNVNKVRELKECLDLEHIKLSCMNSAVDIIEIQDSNVLAIVQDKCQRAFDSVNKENCKPIITLVEDTSLNFKALGGLPGPYIKWFLKAIGPTGLYRMLIGFEDKSAEAVCIYALMPSRQKVLFFRGVAEGRVVEPAGATGWGWDSVFLEHVSGLTFGQMDVGLKSKFSHRASAVRALKSFLEKCTLLEGPKHRMTSETVEGELSAKD